MKKIISIGIFLALIALPLKAADLGGQVVSIGSDTTYPPHEFIEDLNLETNNDSTCFDPSYRASLLQSH